MFKHLYQQHICIRQQLFTSCTMHFVYCCLTHWGRVTHIFVSKLIIIGSDNGLSPGRRQAIIWTNAVVLFIGPLGANFNETSIEINTFPFKKINLKMSSGKWRTYCLVLKVLTRLLCGTSSAVYSSIPFKPGITNYIQLKYCVQYIFSALTLFVVLFNRCYIWIDIAAGLEKLTNYCAG